MSRIKLSLLFIVFFLSISAFAAEVNGRMVSFALTDRTIPTTSGMVIRPLSITMPPEGCLLDTVLLVNLNNASCCTIVNIEKDGEGIVYRDVLAHDANKVVEYDLSVYGSGEYVISVTFSSGDTYDATFVVE